MAQLVIQDILSSDNVAVSRSVISSNFKVLVDGINKIETYLNTSPNGGTLNIATLTVNKYSRPITDIIFTIQASANIAGNLTLGTVGQGTTLTINSIPTFNYDATFKKNVTFEKLPAGNSISVQTKLSIEDILVVPVGIGTTIAVDGTDIDVSESTCINLEWAATGSSPVLDVNFEDGVDGQLLIIRNLGTYDVGKTLNFNNIDASLIVSISTSILANFQNSKMIFQFVEESGANRWELISIVGLAPTEYTIG